MSGKYKIGTGIGVMILKNNKVLFGKRNENPETADSELHGEGTWTMPGGKIEYKESFEDAAFREVLEETGIKINKDKLKLISISNDVGDDAHFITIGFLATDFSENAKVMEPDEITEWRWFDINKLPSPIFSCSEKILKNYLDNIIYKK
jgi:8-oxo-dGTP diphosphatase